MNQVTLKEENAPNSDNTTEINSGELTNSEINIQENIKQEPSDEEMQPVLTCAPEEGVHEIELFIGMETVKSETYQDDRNELDDESIETRIKLEFVENKFQSFADNLAAQLNQMPLDKALKLQMDIEQLVEKQRFN